MVRGSLALAAAFVLTGTAAQAQGNRNVNPLRYNNPVAQGNMYNSSPVLRFNNPTAQAGMYANDPVLRYNNPLNQVGMYGGNNWNNPAFQGGYNGYGWNNPLSQTNMYGGNSFNNPLYSANPNAARGNAAGVTGAARSNANASSMLNGTGGRAPGYTPKASGAARRRSTGRRR